MVLVAVMSAAGATAQRAPAPASAMTVAGVELVDTLGQKVDLRGVVTGATPSVISFTYLGCRSICPTSDLVMDQVARLLEESPGQGDVQLLTLTIDPFNDTPELLARRAVEIGSSIRRRWLSGEPEQVFGALDGLGMQFGRLDEHGAFFVVVRDQGRTLQRVNGVPDPSLLLAFARGA
ncbi:MAG: SCO family protein [Hyphomicrobiaceae bacterium]